MTKPSPELLRACAIAGAHMANRTTPLILNEWYVAAFAAELGHTLTRRRLLDRNVALYHARDGRPAALDERCAHRSFPLFPARLDGETIARGYHSFRYDPATVAATLNAKIYQTGEHATDEEMGLLRIRAHRTLPE